MEVFQDCVKWRALVVMSVLNYWVLSVATSEVYGELKERAMEVGLIINVEKTKAMVQSRRPRKGGAWTVGIRRLKWSGDSDT